MIDLVTTCPLVKVKRTSETGDHYTVPYYHLGQAFFVYGMTESAADEFIEMIDAGADGATLFSFYLYDEFASIEDMLNGFHKFFYHLIYKNQWMVQNTVNIMCPTSEIYNALKSLIQEDQRKITETEKIWPSAERDMLEQFNPQLELRSAMTLTNSPPFFGAMRCETHPSADLKVAEIITSKEELLYSATNRKTYTIGLKQDITKKLGGAGTSTRREDSGYIRIEIWDTPQFHSVDYVPGEGEALDGWLLRHVGVGGGYEIRVRS